MGQGLIWQGKLWESISLGLALPTIHARMATAYSADSLPLYVHIWLLSTCPPPLPQPCTLCQHLPKSQGLGYIWDPSANHGSS